jgi:FlaA1/EpsC-like NDP-sugar epimerase
MLTLPRQIKQVAMITSDIVGFGCCALISYWAVAGPVLSPKAALAIAAIAVVTGIAVTWASGLYVSIIRYMGLNLVAAGARATFFTALLVSLVGGYFELFVHPVRFGIVFWTSTLLYLVGGRLTARLILNRQNREREQVIIYGAGDGGAQLTAMLFGADDYLPVAMVDDDTTKHGKRVHGLRVYSPDKLPRLLERTKAQGVLMAVPTATRRRRREILEWLSKFPVHVRTVPDIKDIVSGKARVDDVSEVDVTDLLGRDLVPPDEGLLEACIHGKSVMVTGAGGSIGSELCRQILLLRPKRLICFEISEPALYDVDRELRKKLAATGIDCEIYALLGSVHHEDRIREAISVFGVQTIYHAAAYKHVPIVEQNVLEGVHNNVFGTLHTARAAADAGVETFVLISTDKAVIPTNVMGATKRLAELVLQAYNRESPDTRFCIVRFGNVLESSGSVVPLFREQIRHGGPVTVTHRDIIRYFMTIPEAAQLVIQAGSMANGGDVFVLDMGEPVRIADLAHRMINLMGLTVRDESNPDGDIEVQYIGLRPAEKLYEELLIGSNVSGTAHSRIMRADEDCLAFPILAELIAGLKSASQRQDYELARDILKDAVREYNPSNDIDDLVWTQRTGTDSQASVPTVVEFPKQPK